MASNVTGVLKKVDGKHILIDDTWYVVEDTKYVPKDVDSKVEFRLDTDDPTLIKFIKRFGDTGSKTTYKSGGGRYVKDETTHKSILRQVALKAAVEYNVEQVDVKEVIEVAREFEAYLNEPIKQ